jgi:hypothetical protein
MFVAGMTHHAMQKADAPERAADFVADTGDHPETAGWEPSIRWPSCARSRAVDRHHLSRLDRYIERLRKIVAALR